MELEVGTIGSLFLSSDNCGPLDPPLMSARRGE